jgi:thiamine-monophosphate kinase
MTQQGGRGSRGGAAAGTSALGPGAEFDFIRSILARRTAGPEHGEHVRVGPGDDCAVIAGDGIAVSVDMAVEGVHFRRDWIGAKEIGYRCVAAALSDLAAVAAAPIGVCVALGTPDADRAEFALQVMAGAQDAAAAAGASLLGGDVTRTPGPLMLDVVVLGNAPTPILRSGARSGDSLWVTGELGAAALAVRTWRNGQTPAPAARSAYARPRPRIKEARWLADRRALHALIDLSDGLAGDAAHIAAASGVRIVLDATSIPIHPLLRSTPQAPVGGASSLAISTEEALRLALSGGDDYELCFAAPAGAVEDLAGDFNATFGTPLTRVGTVHEGAGLWLRIADGEVAAADYGGYDHFGGVP